MRHTHVAAAADGTVHEAVLTIEALCKSDDTPNSITSVVTHCVSTRNDEKYDKEDCGLRNSVNS